MGNSYQKIMFMVIDNTPIEVVSATKEKDFELKTLWDFANKRGGFSEDCDNRSHYIWESPDKKEFVEFYTKAPCAGVARQ